MNNDKNNMSDNFELNNQIIIKKNLFLNVDLFWVVIIL